jgi:hypothetical protein
VKSLEIFSKFGTYTNTFKYLKDNPENVCLLWNFVDRKDSKEDKSIRFFIFEILIEYMKKYEGFHTLIDEAVRKNSQ